MFSPLLADSVNNVTHTPWLPEQRSPLASPTTRPPDKMCYSVLICVFYWFSFQTINCWKRILDNAGIICQSRSLINGTAIGKGSLAIRKYIARILNVAPSLLRFPASLAFGSKWVVEPDYSIPCSSLLRGHWDCWDCLSQLSKTS